VPKLKPWLFGSLFGASLTFVGMRYHVVRYEEGVMLVSRSQQPPLRSTYVDIRDWGAAMWKQYPEVATALVNGGHSQLVAEHVAADLLNEVDAPSETPSASSSLDELSSLRTRSTSTTRKPAIVPIRLQPAERSLDSKASEVDLGESASTPGKTRAIDKAVSSALESLFAPYGRNGSQNPDGTVAASSVRLEWAKDVPVQPASNSIPKGADAQSKPLMDLKSLDVELGEPVKFTPSGSPPRQAGSGVPNTGTNSAPIDLGLLEQAEPL